MTVTEMKAKGTIDPDRIKAGVSYETLLCEMRAGFEALRTETRLRGEKQIHAIQALSEKLDYAIDIRERLAVLEDRLPRS